VTTQLRLVDPPEEPRSRRSAPKAGRRARTGDRPRAATSNRVARTGRRAAGWGDWHLDASTRRVGRAGVARARRALEAAVEQELSRAS
jgi:hypothetical protein